jgi:VWFA-related protein
VLSDGLDTGSPHSLSDAIESVQEAETVVYAIKYVDAIMTPRGSTLVRKMTGNRGLERLTDETGGYTFPNPENRMPAVFTKIEDDLRNLYVIGFTPPEAYRDGRFHKLEVKTIRKDLIVRSRAGYYAQAR